MCVCVCVCQNSVSVSAICVADGLYVMSWLSKTQPVKRLHIYAYYDMQSYYDVAAKIARGNDSSLSYWVAHIHLVQGIVNILSPKIASV